MHENAVITTIVSLTVSLCKKINRDMYIKIYISWFVAFIAEVIGVLRGCLQTEYFTRVKALNVCECVYVWVYVTAVWPSKACWPCIAPQHCIYTHQDTRTYTYRQTDRLSGWISKIVAALAHLVQTRILLRCGWRWFALAPHTIIQTLCVCM